MRIPGTSWDYPWALRDYSRLVSETILMILDVILGLSLSLDSSSEVSWKL